MNETQKKSPVSIQQEDLTEWGQVCTIERCSAEVRQRLAKCAAHAVPRYIKTNNYRLAEEYGAREVAWCRMEAYLIATMSNTGESQAKSYKERMLSSPNPAGYLGMVFRTIAKEILAQECWGNRNLDGSLSKRHKLFSLDAPDKDDITMLDRLAGDTNETGDELEDWQQSKYANADRASDDEQKLESGNSLEPEDKDEPDSVEGYQDGESASCSQADLLFFEPESDGDSLIAKLKGEKRAREIWEEADTNERLLLAFLSHNINTRTMLDSGFFTIKKSALYTKLNNLKQKIMTGDPDSRRAIFFVAPLVNHLQLLSASWLENKENFSAIHLFIEEHTQS